MSLIVNIIDMKTFRFPGNARLIPLVRFTKEPKARTPKGWTKRRKPNLDQPIGMGISLLRKTLAFLEKDMPMPLGWSKFDSGLSVHPIGVGGFGLLVRDIDNNICAELMVLSV